MKALKSHPTERNKAVMEKEYLNDKLKSSEKDPVKRVPHKFKLQDALYVCVSVHRDFHPPVKKQCLKQNSVVLKLDT